MNVKELCELKYLLRRYKEDYVLDSTIETLWIDGLLEEIDNVVVD